MKSNTPLINLAILESLKRKANTDEIDLIIPYAILALNEIEGDSFDPLILKDLLKENFGFNPPPSAFDVILTRILKRGYAIRKNKLFFKVSDKISPLIDKNRDVKKEVTISITKLINDFCSFTKNKHDIELSTHDAEILFFDFINKHISIFVVTLENGKYDIEDKKIKNREYLTSTFIKNIYEDKTESIKHLETIVKGALLANYITLADTTASKKKLKNITVKLDTPLLIGLLGYNGKSKADSLKDFIHLLKEVEINVEVFDITIDEIKKVMGAWKSDLIRNKYDDFNPKTLELLKSRGYDIAGLESEIILVQNNIEALGIKVSNNIDYDVKYQCDVVKFEEKLRKRSHRHRNLTHDVKSVSQIYSSRKGKTIDTLDNEFSVFITHGTTLPKTVIKFFKDDKVVGKIPLVSNEKWMATIAWFKKPNAFPDMPINLVVSSAYNVVYSDDKFWNSFISKLNNLEKRGKISEDDFMLVRWDSGLVELAHNTSIKSGENFTDEDVFDIVQGIKDKIVGSHKKEIISIKGNHDSKLEIINEELETTKGNLKTVTKSLTKIEGLIESFSKSFSYIISWLFNIIIVCFILYGLYLSSTKNQIAGIIGGISIFLLLILTFFNLYIGTEIKKTSEKVRLYIYNKTNESINKFIN
ncbi:MAG: hypothetical protein ACJA1D_001829 [Polaribacter sp.]|jgi:hypothetical protein